MLGPKGMAYAAHMKRWVAPVAIIALTCVTLSGCASGDDDPEVSPSPTPSTSTSTSTTTPTPAGTNGTGSSSGEATTGAEGSSTPTPTAATTPNAVVTWGDQVSTYLLVQCQHSGTSTLNASGDDVSGGTLLTIDVVNGDGALSIANDSTLETELDGTLSEFTLTGTSFSGSGSYQNPSGDDRDFTVTGDCVGL